MQASLVPEERHAERHSEPRAARGAVLSMTLCVIVLIASEFLPVSLLTPLAADLGVTEGRAGQAISISGLFAVVTGLFVARWTRNVDRRIVQTGFAALLVVSGLIVTFAPNYPVLMAGRAVLGVAIGGFWSMSTAIVMRLLPENRVAQGLALLNGGVALASTVSAPLGSYLADIVGWRGAFVLVVPVAVAATVWQWVSLPPLPPRGRARRNVARLLARRQVAFGMAAILLLFMGQFTLFTYLRPFLQGVALLPVPALSLVFLLMGLGGLAGSWAIARALRRGWGGPVVAVPLALAAVALLLIPAAGHAPAVAVLLALWGLISAGAPVAWGTWLARTLPDEAEAGGGLQVAVIQFAIMAGAAGGGAVFDGPGWQATFALAALLLAGSSLAAALALRAARNHRSGV